MKLLAPILWIILWATDSWSQECILRSEDVRKIIQQNNLELKLADLRTEVAKTQANQTRAFLDTSLELRANHQIDKNEPVISVFGTRNDTTQFSGTVNHTFPTGTQTSLGYLTNRQKTNSPFAAINPAYDSHWFFTLRQPLLNNFFGKATINSIEAANLAAVSVEQQTLYLRDQILFTALENYWSWVGSLQDEQLVQQALARSEEFLKTTQRLLRYGTAEKSSLFAAQANVEQREKELIEVREYKRNLFLELVTRMRAYDLGECKAEKENFLSSPNLEQLLAQSTSNRKDYQALSTQLRSSQLEVASAKSLKRPRLDLVTTLDFNQLDEGWGTSAATALDPNHVDWFIGAEVTIPFQNRRAKSEYDLRLIGEKQNQIELKKLEDQIAFEIRQTWQSKTSVSDRIQRGKNIVTLQEKKLEAARKDFNIGRETSFTVLSYQQDLILAQRQLLALETQEKILHETLNLVSGNFR